MQQEKGIALISILIFSGMISLLVIMGLEASELQMRMSSNMQFQAQKFQVAIAGLKKAEMAVSSGATTCQTNFVTSELIAQTSSWWKSAVTCHGSFANKNYQYIIKSLVIDPCLTFDNKNAVQFWQITARGEGAKNSTATFLQVTIATSIKTQEKCDYQPKKLQSIQQSFKKI
jgi:Tfp pilus assembly protein PilX